MNDKYTLAYVGLGSNEGDRIQNIIDTCVLLDQLNLTHHSRRSSLYLSSPVGDEYLDQQEFVNCVVELTVDGSAEVLHDEMQAIEKVMGRIRDEHHIDAPRTMDCDLLLYGDQKIKTGRLTVPHVSITERLFVLQPLCELNPTLSVDGQEKLQQLLQRGLASNYFVDQSILKLG